MTEVVTEQKPKSDIPKPTEWSIIEANSILGGLEDRIDDLTLELATFDKDWYDLRRLAVEQSLTEIPPFFRWKNQLSIENIPESIGFLQKLTTDLDIRKHEAQFKWKPEALQVAEEARANVPPQVQVNVPVVGKETGKGVIAEAKEVVGKVGSIFQRRKLTTDPRRILSHEIESESTVDDYRQFLRVWNGFIKFYHAVIGIVPVIEDLATYPKTRHPKMWFNELANANEWLALLEASIKVGIIAAAEMKRDKLERERVALVTQIAKITQGQTVIPRTFFESVKGPAG